MDIADINLLKRDAEAAIAEALNVFMDKSKSRVLRVDISNVEVSTHDSPCQEYRVNWVYLDVRV